MKRYLLFFVLALSFKLNALDHLNCLILLNEDDTESIGNTSRFYLMSKLQSAIAEQASSILVHASLWNSFIERRTSFEHRAGIADTRESKILRIYNSIQERIQHLSNDYNSTSDDIAQNKALVQ